MELLELELVLIAIFSFGVKSLQIEIATKKYDLSVQLSFSF